MSMPSLSQSQHNAADRQTIRSGRGWILAISLINLVAGGIFGALSGSEDGADADGVFFMAMGMLIVGVIFLGCWIWAKKSPFPAAVTALIIFIALHASAIAMDPAELVRGILIKLLFLFGLISAVQSAYRLKKSEQESLVDD